MPKLSGLFDSFDNLDQIDIESVARWLKPSPQIIQLENYLANRILYPQTVPLSSLDIKIELAILREVIRINGPKVNQKSSNNLLGENPFLNITLRKVLIPAKFLEYIPDLTSLTWAFVDGLLLNRHKEDWFQDLWTVILTGQTDEIVGSIILPQFNDRGAALELKVEGKSFKVTAGSLMVVPCPKNRCEIAFKFNRGKILGQDSSAIEIYGGRLGLMIDGRI